MLDKNRSDFNTGIIVTRKEATTYHLNEKELISIRDEEFFITDKDLNSYKDKNIKNASNTAAYLYSNKDNLQINDEELGYFNIILNECDVDKLSITSDKQIIKFINCNINYLELNARLKKSYLNQCRIKEAILHIRQGDKNGAASIISKC